MLLNPARLLEVNGPPLISLAIAEGWVELTEKGRIGSVTSVPTLFWENKDTDPKKKDEITASIVLLNFIRNIVSSYWIKSSINYK